MSDSEEEILLKPQIPNKQKKRRNRKKNHHNSKGDTCVVCYEKICLDLKSGMALLDLYEEDEADNPTPEKAVLCQNNHKVCFNCASNMIGSCFVMGECNDEECRGVMYKCPICRGVKSVRPILQCCIYANSYKPFYQWIMTNKRVGLDNNLSMDTLSDCLGWFIGNNELRNCVIDNVLFSA